MTLLRPTTTTWFEILAPRVECAKSLGNLGRSGAVEIEVRPHEEELLNVRELAGGLDAYHQLRKQYHRYWARGVLRHAPKSHAPREVLDHALRCIDEWRLLADPLIAEMQSLEEERYNLRYCHRFLSTMQHSAIDFSLTSEVGPVLSIVSAILPLEAELVATVPSIAITMVTDEDLCVLYLIATEHADILRNEIKAADGRLIVRPPWIKGSAREALALVIERSNWLERAIVDRYTVLDELYEDQGMADALGDVACLEWFLEQVGTLEAVGSNMVWITGWTTADKVEQLGDILSEAGVPALVHSPPPPEGAEPPQLLRNPWWSKPFELFARAFGTLGATEIDPSPLLALIVPLLFGYMFADVGQGLVLVLVGIWLRQRNQIGNLLVAAGLSATLFGFLFGSIFSYEQIIPALWLHPLDEPLYTLAIPLLFGALLLTLGQLLAGVESMWRGAQRNWLLKESGLLLFYLGVLAGLVIPRLMILAPIGAIWFITGNLLAERRWTSLISLISSLGKLVEDGMRLLVNTVSFARVGAFALAHAGLSSALVSLAESVNSIAGTLLIVVLGNALIIVLEGLVVSIQTTRLVLFEFFTRFLEGTGRPFRPLSLPPNVINVTPPTSIDGRHP